MRTELELVIIAIMLLVAALVVLTIFGGGMSQLQPLLNAQSNCKNIFSISCTTSGQKPSTWSTGYVYTDSAGNKQTCAQLLPGCQCTEQGAGYTMTGC